ncbi:hypothetical protein FIBSPDRAFT_1056211 [Athelia psychrophila]|uniref:Uncharacterized protein n=1 Tax=Athelia psychrophila TaxID=1759441 RepID=A0A167SIA1_9AGAM|nr:hypothetical protein FIBSPDRAFT_1056211 [Fibularhizoctonia sp. CBS 109695]
MSAFIEAPLQTLATHAGPIGEMAASRRCKWVSKAAAGMAATIQLTHAETSLVVAWYRRVVELEKGFLPHDNC